MYSTTLRLPVSTDMKSYPVFAGVQDALVTMVVWSQCGSLFPYNILISVLMYYYPA